MGKYRIFKNKVEYLDDRFYRFGDDFYPSVTTITSNWPKGPSFEQWLRDNGNNSKRIVEQAAEEGSQVHDAIEQLLLGNEISHEPYDVHVWEMIMKAHNFFTRHKFSDIKAEANYVSRELGYGGTIDFIGVYKGEIWLIDFKTSNSVHYTQHMQLNAYRHLYNDAVKGKGAPVKRLGILHLKSTHRTEKEFQGIGYKLVEVTDWDKLDTSFQAIRSVFNVHMAKLKPRILSYPTKLKL